MLSGSHLLSFRRAVTEVEVVLQSLLQTGIGLSEATVWADSWDMELELAGCLSSDIGLSEWKLMVTNSWCLASVSFSSARFLTSVPVWVLLSARCDWSLASSWSLASALAWYLALVSLSSWRPLVPMQPVH